MTQLPEPSDLNVRTSPAFVVMFVEPGSAMDVDATIVQEPENLHSRTIPAATVPREVIDAEPVI